MSAARDHRALVEARLLAGGVALQLAGLLEDLDHVDDHAARGERLQVLEPELGHVVLVDVLPHRGLVVVAVPLPMCPMPSRCVPTWLWLSQVSSM